MPTPRRPLAAPAAVPINSTGRSALLAPTGPARLENARQLPVDQIDLNPQQARQQFDEVALDELTASVTEHGVLQPILVRSVGERWEIIAGERRYRAAVRAGRPTIPAVIRDDLDSADAIIVTALENLQRQDLAPGDEARQYARLLEAYGCSERDLARRLSINDSRIWRLLRLLREAPDQLDAIDAGQQTVSGALRALTPPGELLQNEANSHPGSSEEAAAGLLQNEANSHPGSSVTAPDLTLRAELPDPRRVPFDVARAEQVGRLYKPVARFELYIQRLAPDTIPDADVPVLVERMEAAIAVAQHRVAALKARIG